MNIKDAYDDLERAVHARLGPDCRRITASVAGGAPDGLYEALAAVRMRLRPRPVARVEEAAGALRHQATSANPHDMLQAARLAAEFLKDAKAVLARLERVGVLDKQRLVWMQNTYDRALAKANDAARVSVARITQLQPPQPPQPPPAR